MCTPPLGGLVLCVVCWGGGRSQYWMVNLQMLGEIMTLPPVKLWEHIPPSEWQPAGPLYVQERYAVSWGCFEGSQREVT